MAEDACPLNTNEVRAGLGRLQPSESWLRNERVESVLGWRRGAIASFLASMAPPSTTDVGARRTARTLVSDTQRVLEDGGIFFHKDYVAVTHPKAQRPHRVGRLMEVAEPRRRPLTPDCSEEPPRRIAHPTPPDSHSTEGGEDQPEASDGALSSPCGQREDVVESDPRDQSEDRAEEDAASDDGVEVLSLSAVREVGEGLGESSTSPGEVDKTGEGDTDTESEDQRYV